jgi:uncharacterized protein (DUF169 family)
MDSKKISEELLRSLRPRTYPVGVKFYEDESDVPETAKAPGAKMSFCQIVGMARESDELVFLANKNNIICAFAKANLGFEQLPKNMARRFAPVRTATEEAFQNIVDTAIKMEYGRFQAAVVASLETNAIEPDIILIFVDGLQMSRLMYAITYWEGKRLSINTASECGTCGEGLATAYVNDEPTISFPCYGTRRLALAYDNELILCFPTKYAENITEGLRRTQMGGFRYPMAHQFTTPQPPAVYRIRTEEPPSDYLETTERLKKQFND